MTAATRLRRLERRRGGVCLRCAPGQPDSVSIVWTDGPHDPPPMPPVCPACGRQLRQVVLGYDDAEVAP